MDKIKCPKCGSDNTATCEGIFRNGEKIYLRDCLDCDWFAAATTQEYADVLFEQGGIKREN